MARTLILDFDGTTTLADVGDEICARFADPTWRDLDLAWERKEISLQDAQRVMWKTIRAGAAEVLAHTAEIGAIRGGFDRLLDAAERGGWRLILASGGFDFYISAILGPARLARFHTILCNRGELLEGGVAVSFPLAERYGCPLCAVCKGRVVDEELAAGREVVFIGDGTSDRCVIGRVKTLWVVRASKLAAACAAASAEHRLFDDFDEIAATLISPR